jgi:hypothetical protein
MPDRAVRGLLTIRPATAYSSRGRIAYHQAAHLILVEFRVHWVAIGDNLDKEEKRKHADCVLCDRAIEFA